VLWTVDHTSSIICRYLASFLQPNGTNLYCLVTELQGVNNLPKVVMLAMPEQELNPQPLDFQCDAVPVAQPHHFISTVFVHEYQNIKMVYM